MSRPVGAYIHAGLVHVTLCLVLWPRAGRECGRRACTVRSGSWGIRVPACREIRNPMRVACWILAKTCQCPLRVQVFCYLAGKKGYSLSDSQALPLLTFGSARGTDPKPTTAIVHAPVAVHPLLTFGSVRGTDPKLLYRIFHNASSCRCFTPNLWECAGNRSQATKVVCFPPVSHHALWVQ